MVPLDAPVAHHPLYPLLQWQVVRFSFVTLLANFIFIICTQHLILHHLHPIIHVNVTSFELIELDLEPRHLVIVPNRLF